MDAGGKSPRTLLIIGGEIALWRKAHGYTQETFAQAVGIPLRVCLLYTSDAADD